MTHHYDPQLEARIREAAREVLDRYTPGSTGAPEPPTGPLPEPHRRSSKGVVLAAAAIVLIAVAIGAIVRFGGGDAQRNVVVDRSTKIPRSARPSVAVVLGRTGAEAEIESTAVLVDAATADPIRNVDLPIESWSGGFGGFLLTDMVSVRGKLQFVYDHHTDMISVLEGGPPGPDSGVQHQGAAVIESGGRPGASSELWSEGGIWPDRTAEYLKVSPRGAVAAVEPDESHPSGVDHFWTLESSSGSGSPDEQGSERAEWIPSATIWGSDQLTFSPDGSAVGAWTNRGGPNLGLVLHALSDDCVICDAGPNAIPDRLADSVLGAGGFLDATHVWLWSTDFTPSAQRAGLAVIDLRTKAMRTVDLPPPFPIIDEYFQLAAASPGDGNLFLLDPDGLSMWRWDGHSWSELSLPTPPEGEHYAAVFAFPDTPTAPPSPNVNFCDEELHGPTPTVPGLGQVRLRVSGDETHVEQIGGLAEVLHDDGNEPISDTTRLWMKDCRIAVRDDATYTGRRFLLRLAHISGNEYALIEVKADPWNGRG